MKPAYCAAVVIAVYLGAADEARCGYIYWSDLYGGDIRRANLDGTGQETLITGLPGPGFIALDLTAIPEPPDYNGNGSVEQGDLDLVLLNWRTPAMMVPSSWTNVRPFGRVDQDELDAVLLHWGEGTPIAAASSVARIPEPNELGLSLVMLIAILVFSRRSATFRFRA